MTHPSTTRRDPRTGIPLSWIRHAADKIRKRERSYSSMRAEIRARRELEEDWAKTGGLRGRDQTSAGVDDMPDMPA